MSLLIGQSDQVMNKITTIMMNLKKSFKQESPKVGESFLQQWLQPTAKGPQYYREFGLVVLDKQDD